MALIYVIYLLSYKQCYYKGQTFCKTCWFLQDSLALGQQTKFKALAYTAYENWIIQTDSDVVSLIKASHFIRLIM